MTGTILREIASYGFLLSTATFDIIEWTIMAAVDPRTGEIFVVETDQGQFEAACELARMVGIEVEDG